MQLYNVLSSATLELINDLFPAKIIGRAIEYVHASAIKSISYDKKTDVCVASVYGSRQYVVTIRPSRVDDEIEIACSCPGAASRRHIVSTLLLF